MEPTTGFSLRWYSQGILRTAGGIPKDLKRKCDEIIEEGENESNKRAKIEKTALKALGQATPPMPNLLNANK